MASSSASALASAELTEQLALVKPRRRSARTDENNNMALMLDAPVLNKGYIMLVVSRVQRNKEIKTSS